MTTHRTTMKVRYMAKKIVQLFFITVAYGLVCTPSLYSQGINLCTDRHGNSVYTDNACPAGFTRKKQSERKIVKVQEPTEEDDKELLISWEKYKISLDNVEMGWHLVKEQTNQDAVIYPQVDFRVTNGGAEPVSRLKIIMSFTDETSQSLGATHKYIKMVLPGSSSDTISMSPARGYSYDEQSDYNDYQKNIIIGTRITVEITARYMGEKKQVGIMEFSSNLVR